MAPRASRRFSSHPAPPPGYSVDPNVGPMLRFQKSVPPLPVPTLASTLPKYLESVQPHLSPAAFKTTKSRVEAFLQSEQAAELQRRLEARAAEPGKNSKNWLADWWNDIAYMGYRDPVVVFVSYFYVHMADRTVTTPEKRAAQLVKAVLPFRELVETQQLEPDKVRQTPLCMESYKWLFNSSRYPVKPSDVAKKFDAQKNHHVIFIRKNRFFEVQLASNGQDLTTAELEAQISKIIQTAGEGPATAPAIGALTSENRDVWTDAREALLAASPQNAASLERIESSVIVVCLDDISPVTREDIGWACWVGNGRNRFYDKHQLIVFENGKSGFLGEHSSMDGTPTLRMNEFILSSLAHHKIDHGANKPVRDLPAPTELTFGLNDTTKKYISEAETHFDELVGQHDMHVLHYEAYGSKYIKTNFKVSPDAWAQMVKQLAFHKMFNRPGVCYESAQTRRFQFGRTEVIRSASNESKKWAEAMLDPHVSNTERAALLRKAAARHMEYASWAAAGQGVDRHLLGLKKMLREDETLPEIYTDEAFGKSNHWELSTSNLSSPWLDGWGYGEVVPDGYGLSYSIGEDYIRWTITSLKRNTADLKHYLAEAATDMKVMMEHAVKEEGAHAHAPAKGKL